MEPFVRGFVKASLAWLGIGVLIGLAMAFRPGEALAYRPAHMHANLLGFVSMMIFGVAYHVMPRFTGNPLFSRGMARLHFAAANLGLALMVGGFVLRVHWFPAGELAVRGGAALSGLGAFLFIVNLWRTVGPDPAAVARMRPPARPARASSSAA